MVVEQKILNNKQHDKKLSLKVAYTPNEHNEYALALADVG